jgi:hypothetical protein
MKRDRGPTCQPPRRVATARARCCRQTASAHSLQPPFVSTRRGFSRLPRFTPPRPCAPPAYYSQHQGRFRFSPPCCVILFPSPSRLCIMRSSCTAPLLLMRDVKDRRAGHRSSHPRVSGLTSPSSALASSNRPPSCPRRKSPNQS